MGTHHGASQKSTEHGTIEVGFWLAVVLKGGIAPLRCYVGQVQATDVRGFRMTLIDWLVGRACGWDVFIPWENVESCLIATPEHDLRAFGESAEKWQTSVCESAKEAKVPEEQANG